MEHRQGCRLRRRPQPREIGAGDGEAQAAAGGEARGGGAQVDLDLDALARLRAAGQVGPAGRDEGRGAVGRDVGQLENEVERQVARRELVAAQKGISLSTVKGTGPYGRITKHDVETAKAGGAVAPVATAPAANIPQTPIWQILEKQGQAFEAIPNNNIKKVTARRLSESKQTIPHFYLSVDCKLDNLLAMRKRINESGGTALKQRSGSADEVKVSVNDFIIRAVALAMREVPAANAVWTDDAVLKFKDVDVSVAVATPNGLITPIIRKADTKGLAAISAEMKDLAERARAGKLKPEEFQGGGFTISNLGMFGIKQFSAIINPPQSCILAVGAGEQRPVVENGKIEIANVMTCTLSVDHRSVDGSVGAEFIGAFKRRIEDPALMLL